jgi:hypothetical protein
MKNAQPIFGSRQEAELRRLAHVKSSAEPIGEEIGQEMLSFFKSVVAKRQTKLVKIAEIWEKLVPELLRERCALEGLNRGTLTVLIDSSSHLYDLKQLLLAGLEQQILMACKPAGLKKISLKPGRWYEGESQAERRLKFH